MPTPEVIGRLGLVTGSPRLVLIQPPNQAAYARPFFDYASAEGIQARVYYPDTNPHSQIWLMQYTAEAAHQDPDIQTKPLVLAQIEDEPLSIDGNSYSAQNPALVVFTDQQTGLSMCLVCLHDPAHMHAQYQDCLRASENCYYEITGA